MRAPPPELSLRLHELPNDVLVALLQRAAGEDLDLVAQVPCRTVSAAARTDSLWAPALRRCFGAALAARVAASLEGGGVEAEVEAEAAAERGASDPERVPGWLLEPVRLSSKTQQAFVASCRIWRAQPAMRTAYRILARLVPPSFASDPEGWVLKLTSGEPREEDKARVLAAFMQLNAKRWARSRDSAADDEGEHRRVASVLSHYITTSRKEPGASLPRATCRMYAHSFGLAGLELIEAIRLFLHETQMPKEGRRMCHLLWAFAGAYYEQNGGYVPDTPRDLVKGPPPDADTVPLHGRWRSHDCVYLMVMSLVFLNADAHNPAVKTKLSEQAWVHSTTESLRINAISTSSAESSALGASERDTLEESAVDEASLKRMYRQVLAQPLLSLNDYTAATSMRPSFVRQHQGGGWRDRISSAFESLSSVILS